ncbi:hypothetical protein C6963_03735 [Escherichia coli]|nr:hypothetical protein C6963_03735 [Escherichia coli]
MIWQPEFTDKTLSRKPGAVQPLSGGAFLCRMCHSFLNSEYCPVTQGAIFSDVMKVCRKAERIGNDPVEKTLTQIPMLSYRETGIT